jgi:hypothetical protein
MRARSTRCKKIRMVANHGFMAQTHAQIIAGHSSCRFNFTITSACPRRICVCCREGMDLYCAFLEASAHLKKLRHTSLLFACGPMLVYTPVEYFCKMVGHPLAMHAWAETRCPCSSAPCGLVMNPSTIAKHQNGEGLSAS